MGMLIMTEGQIRHNWDDILNDPHNNRPDIETPDEYIAEAKAGNVTAGGLQVIVDNGPTRESLPDIDCPPDSHAKLAKDLMDALSQQVAVPRRLLGKERLDQHLDNAFRYGRSMMVVDREGWEGY